MINFLNRESIVDSRSINKNRIILVLFSSSIIIFLIILLITINKNSNLVLSSFNDKNIFADLLFPNIGLVLFWICSLVIILLGLIPLGVFSNYKPKTLQEIITSQNFKIDFSISNLNKEIGIINLKEAIIEIIWEDFSSQFQNWKINITVKINNSSNLESYEELTKLLFMERDIKDHLRHKKIIFIKDWPKQEYLLNYWLNSLKLSN
jgi:hypothetical protein